MADLPLQSKLVRAVETTVNVSGKVTDKDSQVYEGVNDRVNQVRHSWELRYIPLSPADKNTVVNFLALVRTNVVFHYTDGCGGSVYRVRVVKDSVTVARRRGKYTIELTVLENFGG